MIPDIACAMEDMLIKLQTLVGHQEQEIANLSRELYLQQKELVRLSQQFTELAKRFQMLENPEDGVKEISLETPPPHY